MSEGYGDIILTDSYLSLRGYSRGSGLYETILHDGDAYSGSLKPGLPEIYWNVSCVRVLKVHR